MSVVSSVSSVSLSLSLSEIETIYHGGSHEADGALCPEGATLKQRVACAVGSLLTELRTACAFCSVSIGVALPLAVVGVANWPLAIPAAFAAVLIGSFFVPKVKFEVEDLRGNSDAQGDCFRRELCMEITDSVAKYIIARFRTEDSNILSKATKEGLKVLLDGRDYSTSVDFSASSNSFGNYSPISTDDLMWVLENISVTAKARLTSLQFSKEFSVEQLGRIAENCPNLKYFYGCVSEEANMTKTQAEAIANMFEHAKVMLRGSTKFDRNIYIKDEPTALVT